MIVGFLKQWRILHWERDTLNISVKIHGNWSVHCLCKDGYMLSGLAASLLFMS